MTLLYNTLITLAILATLLWIFRSSIISYLIRLRTKMSLASIRTSIHEADADKAKTGRKNIVVYNADTKRFEPVQKKQLKKVSKMKKGKPGRITPERIRNMEKKSIYVTR